MFFDISKDGSVKNNFGELIAYFDLETKRVASEEGFLLGYVSGDIVYDDKDHFIGELNRGTGCILGETGSTLVSLEQSGHCKGDFIEMLWKKKMTFLGRCNTSLAGRV